MTARLLAGFLFAPLALADTHTGGSNAATSIYSTACTGYTNVDACMAALWAAKRTLSTSSIVQYTDNGDGTVTTTFKGLFLGRTVLTSSSGTFTTSANTTTITIRGCGAGGGGGGVTAPGASNGSVGAGGAAGSYFEKQFTVAKSTGYSYTTGTAGTAGASGGGTGGTGGSTTFVVGGTTVTGNGGAGGAFLGTQATIGTALGAAATAVSTNGDLNIGGAPGENGQLTAASGAAGFGGIGGSSPLGAGGGSIKTSGAGSNAVGYCAGGGGALAGSSASAAAGGTGGQGVIIVDEYSGL